ncbi:tRNA pseudouridine(38-40) synthase TruA, partial [Tamlana crocina]|nr:tRNA pseudouridine(38-40) synthase TruA [Tamlana crocina]
MEYFGKAYHGWQRQPNALSVQEVIEQSLGTLLQQKTEIIGAGRTDSGVHARQIFAHFDAEAELEEAFIFRMNSLLPKDISAK